MSLFADGRYHWRETYFVLFDSHHRPKAAEVKRALDDLAPRIELQELVANEAGHLDSVTVLCHADAAGMDIIYVEGDEVKEQIVQIKQEYKGRKIDPKEKPKWDRLLAATARFDIFHFEEISDFPDEEDEGPLDPGTLLLVLGRLAKLCHGESLDPQTGELLE